MMAGGEELSPAAYMLKEALKCAPLFLPRSGVPILQPEGMLEPRVLCGASASLVFCIHNFAGASAPCLLHSQLFVRVDDWNNVPHEHIRSLSFNNFKIVISNSQVFCRFVFY